MAHGKGHKEYWIIFGWLTLLTILEVAIVYVPGIGKTPLVVALILMALSKAGLVGLYFMHLKSETRILRLTVAIPMAMPMFYALVLVAEGVWRMLP
jgi:cytochrome c oxidase subunit IV